MDRNQKSRQRNYRRIALTLSLLFHVLIIVFLIYGTGGEGDQSFSQEVTNWVSGWGGDQPPQP